MNPLRSRLVHGLLLALGLGLLSVGPGPADEPEPKKTAVLKDAPEDVKDLRALEEQVQAVIKKVTPAVVGIRIGQAQGSGVIIDKEGHVLTAGHVSGQPGRDARVILPDGRQLKAKTLGQNRSIDSGMVQITEEGDWPYVAMGDSAELKKGQWVVAIGHPGGFRANRSPVVRVGRVLLTTKMIVRTDCTLVGGDSGGPLFDLDGKVVGIHSRIGGIITENIHVPVATYRDTFDKLAKGESWPKGGALGMQPVVRSVGKVVFEADAKLTRDDPLDKKQADSHHKLYTFKMTPGSTYTIDLVARKGSRKFDPAKPFDPFLRLEDAAGTQLAEDDDGGGELNSRIVFRPTREDDYRIIATTFESGQLGAFRLTVRQVEQKPVADKVDVLRTLEMPRQIAPQVVEEFHKLQMQAFALALLYDAQGKRVAGQPLNFKWQGGEQTLKTDADGTARLELTKGNVKDLKLAVPAGYKAALELINGEGALLPSVVRDDFSKEKVKSAGGRLVLQEQGQLTQADPSDKVRSGCRHKVHTFKMTPGFAYTIDLESEDFDSFLRLEDAAGKQLAEDDDGAGKLNSRIVFRPTTEETFRLVVTTCDPEQFGAYRLTIHKTESKQEPPAERKSERSEDK
jgi:S1-C subfamily serine protease